MLMGMFIVHSKVFLKFAYGVYNISAWASALLILDRRQCESPVCGISDKYRSRAFYYLRLETSGSGTADDT